MTSKIFKQEKQTALCVRRGASDTSSGTITVIGRELPRTQRAPRPASIKTGLPPKKGRFLKYSLLLTSSVMEASPTNDRATVEPLLETIAMELNGGTVPDDLPAADANMQDRREDPDLSASALRTISDIVARQVSLALNSMNRRAPGPVHVTPTEVAATATATTASASQAQTVGMPQTQCPPVTSAFVPLSAGGYSLPLTSSTPLTSTVHHSGQAVFSSCLSRSPYAYPPPSYTGVYGAIPYSRASDCPLIHPSSSRGAGLASEGPTATPTQLSPSLSEYQPQAHDCAASSSMQFEDVSDEESEERPPHNPFEHIPALRNFRLSGARVALSRSKNTRVPSEQTLQLWAHTRGLMEGGNWRGVRANKITSLYTADSQAAAFAAQSRPSVFPLNESAAKRDDFLASQQTRIGAAAHALCTALTRLNDVTETTLLGGPSQASDIFSADPLTPDGRAEFARLVSDQVATPLGHVLRVLAAECSFLCRDRRQLCLVVDLQARADIDKISPSHTSLFDGDIDAVVQTLRHRREAGGAFQTSPCISQEARQGPRATPGTPPRQTATQAGLPGGQLRTHPYWPE